MTELLYLPDNDHEHQFDATVAEVDRERRFVVLDRTQFYPEGGGQPADEGEIIWEGGKAHVEDVQKYQGDVRHYIADDDPLPAEDITVHGRVDTAIRDAHRRMHTAQHVLSRVVLDEYGAGVAGNQIHADWSRIDFEPAEFTAADIDTIQLAANKIVRKGLPVTKEEWSRDRVEREVDPDRSNLDLIPDHVDPLRVIVIDEFDTCPCGGTHVNNTSEIGRIKITDRISKGADVERIEFTLE